MAVTQTVARTEDKKRLPDLAAFSPFLRNTERCAELLVGHDALGNLLDHNRPIGGARKFATARVLMAVNDHYMALGGLDPRNLDPDDSRTEELCALWKEIIETRLAWIEHRGLIWVGDKDRDCERIEQWQELLVLASQELPPVVLASLNDDFPPLQATRGGTPPPPQAESFQNLPGVGQRLFQAWRGRQRQKVCVNLNPKDEREWDESHRTKYLVPPVHKFSDCARVSEILIKIKGVANRCFDQTRPVDDLWDQEACADMWLDLARDCARNHALRKSKDAQRAYRMSGDLVAQVLRQGKEETFISSDHIIGQLLEGLAGRHHDVLEWSETVAPALRDPGCGIGKKRQQGLLKKLDEATTEAVCTIRGNMFAQWKMCAVSMLLRGDVDRAEQAYRVLKQTERKHTIGDREPAWVYGMFADFRKGNYRRVLKAGLSAPGGYDGRVRAVFVACAAAALLAPESNGSVPHAQLSLDGFFASSARKILSHVTVKPVPPPQPERAQSARLHGEKKLLKIASGVT